MDPRLKIALKWLLVFPVAVASMFAAMIGMEFSIVFDRVLIARASLLGIKISPPLLLRPLHLSAMLGIALLLVLPSTLVVGFAVPLRRKVCLPWGFSAATVLAAVYVWFVWPSGDQLLARWAAGAAAGVVIAGIVLTHFASHQRRTHIVANILGIFVLFVPSLSALARPQHYPPEAQRMWTVVLQEQTWQGMNTGSEYAATRQVVFAGDRVLAVFDAGSAGYEGKWPLSNYRLLSLDSMTGTKRDEIDFTGRWGAMPYIYATDDGHIDVQSNPPRVLNPDLSTAEEDISSRNSTDRALQPKTSGECEFMPRNPAKLQDWNFGCSTVETVDGEGKILTQRPVVDSFGRYAGASRDGTRFALESSEAEGDPSFLLYEHFTIYDGNTAWAVAMVPITDLPDRQSWSAFSPDGKYFAVGNPNRLSLYRIP